MAKRETKAAKTETKAVRNTSGLRPFQPGVSGNPGGRPKKSPVTDEMRELLSKKVPGDKEGRTYATIVALRLVNQAITGKGNVNAIRELLDRVEGKPVQSNELSGPGGGPIPFPIPTTREELERQVQLLLSGAKPDQQ
jgi:hypothetical protein